LNLIIDAYKEAAMKLNRFACFDFDFKPTERYANLGEFFSHADTFMLKSLFARVAKDQLDMLTESGQLLVFEVTSSKMYLNGVNKGYSGLFKLLFSEENLASNAMRVNSRPSITFRPACIPRVVTHPTGSMLVNKTYRNGKKIPGNIYREIYEHANGRLETLSEAAQMAVDSGQVSIHPATFDLIKDRRYTEDHFFLSLSYVKNAKVSTMEPDTVSADASENMKEGYKTVSVVRGVKDLLYMNLYDEDQNLIEGKSLNVASGIDYADKLRVLGEDRNRSKSEDWEYTKRIADIKTAYVDMAISEVIKTAVENDAVIAIEDFSDNMKDKMSALDNQVFRKFDTRLENRLADYFTYGTPEGEPGSVSNPMQLASNDPHRKGHLQNGILFRVNPAYTLRDPVTGYTSLFDLSKCTNAKVRMAFLQKFDSIRWNPEISLFEVKFDYRNFPINIPDDKGRKELERTTWTIYIGKPRTDYDSETRMNRYNETPWREVVDKLNEKGLLDKDLSEETLESLGKVLVNQLYDLFERGLRNQSVKACEGNPEEYFSSPARIEDDGIPTTEVRAENLARKLWYTVDRGDIKGNYTVGWLNNIA
jgi:CRISPR-associated protein Cpf1